MFKYLSVRKFIVFLVLATMLALPATHVQPVQAAGTITSCTQSAFTTALAGGGTVNFGVDCSAIPIVLTAPITINTNTTINANLHKVTISGGNITRIFIVSPGIKLELNGVQITNGAAGSLSGGAVEIQSSTTPALKGELVAKNTTFTNNTSLSGNGGAIFINGGKATFENSTFSGNITYGTGNVGLGGAIYSENGDLTIKHVTFSGNAAREGGGGGLHARTQSGTSATVISNSIFTANQGGNCTTGGGAVITDGLYNITFGDTACLPAANHSDPKLSSIGEYGSTMPLFALLEGSPAINLVNNQVPGTCLDYDQRGVPRSMTYCDSGAYEYRLPTTLTITPVASATYGDTVTIQATVTPTASTGLVRFFGNGILIGSASLNAGTATMSTNVLNTGSYSITARYFGDALYEVVDGLLVDPLVINQKQLTVTARNATRKYGTENPQLNWDAAGFENNENGAVFTKQPICTTTAVITSDVGPYPITCSGGEAMNYSFTYLPGELTVTPDVLTVTAHDASRPYGDDNPSFSYGITGYRAGDDINIVTTLPTCSSAATKTSAVTSTYPITCSGGVAKNYSFAFVPGQLTVTPVQLTVVPDAKSRAYGANNPAFTTTITGFKNNETPSVLTNQPTCTTTALITSPVSGSPYPITCDGAAAVNYTFTYPTPGQLTITKAMLTLTAQNKAKFYGSVNPELTYTVAGLVGEDIVTVNCSTSATTSSPVGSYPINCQGEQAANYNFTPVPGSLTVNKAPLTVKANNQIRSYGSPNPELTYIFNGFVLDETDAVVDPKPTCTTTATQASPVSAVPYPITCSGGAAANYTLNYEAGGLTVTKVTLLVTVANKTRNYGADNPDFTYTITNFVGQDDETVIDQLPICTTTATSGSPAGNTYPITCAGASDIDYTFSYQQGTLTITKAPLTVTAENKSRVYGTNNPSFTYTVSGLRTGETKSVFTTPVTCSSAAGLNSPVSGSPYPITCSNGAAANYTFNYVDGELTITKALLTVTAHNKTKLYGADLPALTHVVSGLVSPDTETDFTTPVQCTTDATKNSLVGSFAINCSGGVSVNYDFTYVAGTLTVGKAPLTVKADDKSRVYGSTNPTATFTYSGFVLTDTKAVLATEPTCSMTATATSPVSGSPYPITCSGGVDENYTFIYQNGGLTITKAVLSVVVDNKTRGYGQPNPTFTYTISGYLNDEGPSVVTKQPICSTTADATSPVGTSYEITCAGAEAANYTFNYTPGMLSITDAALTVVVQNKTKTYGSDNPTLTYTIQGLKPGDSEANVFSSPIVCESSAVKSSPVSGSPYWIRCQGGQPINYTVNYIDGELTVTKAELTVTADPIIKGFSQPVPTLTYTITGFVNDENSSVISGFPELTTTATNNSSGGTYPIFTRSGTLAADNYTFKLVDGILNVVEYRILLPMVRR